MTTRTGLPRDMLRATRTAERVVHYEGTHATLERFYRRLEAGRQVLSVHPYGGSWDPDKWRGMYVTYPAGAVGQFARGVGESWKVVL